MSYSTSAIRSSLGKRAGGALAPAAAATSCSRGLEEVQLSSSWRGRASQQQLEGRTPQQQWSEVPLNQARRLQHQQPTCSFSSSSTGSGTRGSPRSRPKLMAPCGGSANSKCERQAALVRRWGVYMFERAAGRRRTAARGDRTVDRDCDEPRQARGLGACTTACQQSQAAWGPTWRATKPNHCPITAGTMTET